MVCINRSSSYALSYPPDNPTYVKANAGCKHFDVHGGPENIPVSRFSFNAVVKPHPITSFPG